MESPAPAAARHEIGATLGPVAQEPDTETQAAVEPAPAPFNRKAARLAATRRRDAVFRRALIAADATALLTALLVSSAVVGGNPLQPLGFLTPLLLVAAIKLMGLYDRDDHRLHKSTVQDVPGLFAVGTVSALIAYLGGEAFFERTPERGQTLLLLVLIVLLMIGLRALARLFARLGTPPERCVVVGNSNRQQALFDALEMSPATHAEVLGVLPLLTRETPTGYSAAALDAFLDERMVDRVIILPGSRSTDELMFAIRELRDAGVKVSLLPDVTRLAGTSVEHDHVGGVTLMGMRRFAITRSSRTIKRAFDIVVAGLLLAVILPVILALMLAVRLDSRGPALFRQERIGLHGRRFKMIKLRSMHVGSEGQREELRHLSTAASGLFKIRDDPRLTGIGAFIRRTSLDELPQLFNVLRGDMSLVGPRPLVPEEDKQIVGHYRNRLDVRPGITGHWQILGSARVSLDEMVKLDYIYMANWSLWNDVVLMIRTVPVVLRRRGI